VSAQPALQEGRYVGKVIKARLAGKETVPPFKYFDKGSMATIGYRAAVADAFGVKVTGLLAYLMWAFIHVAYLGRVGQPARHHVHVGAGAGVHQEPRAPRSSPSSRRTRRSSTTPRRRRHGDRRGDAPRDGYGAVGPTAAR
jgi:hypothetical protein